MERSCTLWAFDNLLKYEWTCPAGTEVCIMGACGSKLQTDGAYRGRDFKCSVCNGMLCTCESTGPQQNQTNVRNYKTVPQKEDMTRDD